MTQYDWKQGGEEWSAPWGSSGAQWSGTVYPRISAYLPVSTILEIGSGFGRWTHYLREYCACLRIVDPDVRCIDACQRRFGDDSRVICHCNDGRSLSMIPDRSIDFVYSFDSLVHVSRDAIEAYVQQLNSKLNADGVAFVHHSNFGEYVAPLAGKLPPRLREILTKAKILVRDHQRSRDMTAPLFRSICEAHGLMCVRQELINWRGPWLIDCLSTFVHVGSKWAGECTIVRNKSFMREARQVRQASQNPNC